ncbi:type IV pilus assembly protein PilQ [Thiohalospira halophila DSM 15071]|uniref:Type IV pilus assembly protein PilQ n=1 Tax=Thiohalospira halophila DSM 15071 TaxID=1123397 RepID=A0A1I1TL68_9GAMM|nr:type IV pilus secretin PilQ [Thiohalospira halophila]SFD56140.1 type IV pilus assembly protein PilQ [Thiohalospira halophila DSM 15071]
MRRAILTSLALLGAGASQAAELTGVRATDEGLHLALDGSAEPTSFTLADPHRVVVDLPGTGSSVQRHPEVAEGTVRDLRVIEAGGRTRVIATLPGPHAHRLRTTEEGVRLALGRVGQDPGPGEPETGDTDIGTSAAGESNADEAGPSTAEARLEGVDFRRGEAGAGELKLALSGPGGEVDIRRHEAGYRLFIDGAEVPEGQRRRYDVRDFATPVERVDVRQRQGGAHLLVHAEGETEHRLHRLDGELTLAVSPRADEEPAQAEEDGEAAYTGDHLSFDVRDADIRSLLFRIGEFTGLNMVVSDSVQGKLTMHLENVPWDQALDHILTLKGLGMRQDGDVRIIAPQQELLDTESKRLKAEQRRDELVPLEKTTLQVNYAKAADIASTLRSEEGGMLSERGSVRVDERTNKILIRDTPANLRSARELVEELDVPVQQVMIETRIVIANDDFSEDLGTRFGASHVSDTNGGVSTAISGSASGTGSAIGENNTGGNDAVTSIGGGDRMAVDLPVSNPAGQLAVSVLDGDTLLDLELSALQAENEGEIVSNPRVITANQHEAVIEQGVEIPYQEASSSGATSVSFKKAVLSLGVTPQITPDGRIIMDLEISKDSVGEVFNGVPSVDTREVTTQALVTNGETVVLGGIYETEQSREVEKVPLLGDLPLLGRLFRHTREVNAKAELLIFVTPRLLEGEPTREPVADQRLDL